MPGSTSRPPTPRPTVPTVLLVLGSALVVLGMFLPWLRSGSVDRNSFQVAAVLDRVAVVRNSTLSWLPGVWPLAAVVVLLPVTLLVVGLRRCAGGAATAIGVLSLLLGVATLVLGAGRAAAGVRLAPTGPAVLAVGAVALMTAGLLLVLFRSRRAAPAPRLSRSTGRAG